MPYRTLALLAVLLAPLGAAAQTVHVVESGETLFRISRTYGLTVDRLRELNGLEGDQIAVGQRLRVSDGAAAPPRRPAPEPAPLPAPRPEPVSERTPPRRPEPAPPRLSAPPREPAPEPTPPVAPADEPEAPAASPSGPRVHVVEAGETLFRIALRYDTTVDELRRANGVVGDQIEVGQRLRVGGGAVASVGAPAVPAPSGGGAPASAPSGPVRLGTARPWSVEDTTVPADLVHFSEPGETLYSIASATGVPVDALVASNALSTAPLVPGTPVYLPRPVDPAEVAERALPPVEAEGLALVFPDAMSGRRTESGEAYDPEAFTASHRTEPVGSVLLVTNPATGRSTFVRVTDRGPVSQAYLVELSAAAADVLGLDPDGAGRVELRRVP